MRTLLYLALVAAAPLAACAKDDAPAGSGAAAREDVPTITIDELDRLLARHAARAVDANGDATRKKLGVIPGAVLLSDYETYAASELPADKAQTLVFYCANTRCGASDEAARKARFAGYTNVRVLPEGIAGWAKAGKQTARL